MTPPTLSKRAQAVINDLITVKGLSYEDAAREAMDLAERAAAPYREAADHLHDLLNKAARHG